MNNRSAEQFFIIKSTIEGKNQEMKANKKDSDEKMVNITEDFKEMLTSNITSIMDQIKISKSSTGQKDSPKPQYPITVVPTHRRSPPLDGGHYTKISGIWTLKHEIISP